MVFVFYVDEKIVTIFYVCHMTFSALRVVGVVCDRGTISPIKRCNPYKGSIVLKNEDTKTRTSTHETMVQSRV